MDTKAETVERLTARLAAGIALRRDLRADAEATRRRLALRLWQATRLARTHADLLADPRFHDTADFFLTEIYGPKDTARRDADVARVVPTLARLLPISGLETVADAIELDTLSEILDSEMVAVLGPRVFALDGPTYGAAWRAVGCRAERAHQLTLIDDLGHALDRLTHHAFAGKALALMRRPARLAGFGDLQTFLETGHRAFLQMGGADEFLDRILTRERAVMTALFAGDDGVLDTPFPSREHTP